jgi:peptidoglycan/LPS O-acetylase OafA/YrhL
MEGSYPLFPPLLVCTMITWGFTRLFDTGQLFPNAHKIKNLLYSLVHPGLYADRVFAIWIFQLMIIMLFLLMIYKRQYLFFLNISLFKRIGVISYSIYLIHEVIGTMRRAQAAG